MPFPADNHDAHDYAECIRERLPGRLQDLREAAGFTKYDLSRESGASIEYIGKIERCTQKNSVRFQPLVRVVGS